METFDDPEHTSKCPNACIYYGISASVWRIKMKKKKKRFNDGFTLEENGGSSITGDESNNNNKDIENTYIVLSYIKNI